MAGFERDANKIVADNIRRLRGERGWSRRILAERASSRSSATWSDWRIVDLEGGRTGSPPASAKWEELVVLSLVFRVPIWDIVLPEKDEMVLIYSRPGDSVDQTERFLLSAAEFAQALSGLDGDRFGDDELRESLRSQTNRAVTQEQISENLRALLLQLDASIRRSRHVVSVTADATAERSGSEDQDPGDSMSS